MAIRGKVGKRGQSYRACRFYRLRRMHFTITVCFVYCPTCFYSRCGSRASMRDVGSQVPSLSCTSCSVARNGSRPAAIAERVVVGWIHMVGFPIRDSQGGQTWIVQLPYPTDGTQGFLIRREQLKGTYGAALQGRLGGMNPNISAAQTITPRFPGRRGLPHLVH